MTKKAKLDELTESETASVVSAGRAIYLFYDRLDPTHPARRKCEIQLEWMKGLIGTYGAFPGSFEDAQEDAQEDDEDEGLGKKIKEDGATDD